MSSIVIDGLSEEDFRRSIQNRLREGKASSTIMRLRALLAPYAGPDGVLPERFLTVEATDLVLHGWDGLGEAAARHDRPGRPVNAVSIAFGWPGEEVPAADAAGNLPPCVETSYFNDDSFPFSQCTRDDLLEGYSFDGCTWSGDPISTDSTITVGGIDDLNAALAALEIKLLASDEPAEADLRAGSLGACLLSALLLQAVNERVGRDGLPRPLCVTAGSSGVYPYFDTPVAGMPPEAIKAAEVEEDALPAGQDVPGPRYSSLLLTGIPRAKKRAVLVLAESDDAAEQRLAGLRHLLHPAPDHSDTGPDEGASELGPVPANSAEPAPDITPLMPIADGGLLLAKKPAKHSHDFRDMLGPRDPALQLRLDSLIADKPAPVAPAPLPAPVIVAYDPDPDWPLKLGWDADEPAEDAPAEAAGELSDDQSPQPAADEAPPEWFPEPRQGRLAAFLRSWLGRFRR